MVAGKRRDIGLGSLKVRATAGNTMDRPALASWCRWALARADGADPVLSGALASGFGLDSTEGVEPGST